ncbi:MAG TPA: type II toxin-antitoxin system VapC family toxin [Roseiflexaceae bacterium]|nr:type II toxin-antitoxin system VapC family toxin [Roseiflexaceae bacterium]
MKYLLDTNVISELVAKQQNQKVIDWLDNLDPSSIYVSVITIGEIRKGIEKTPSPQRKAELTAWLYNDLLVRFSGKIAEITTNTILYWGKLVAQLEQQGQPLSALDSLIAAIALEGDYHIVTRNEDDFTNTGVVIINPWTLP